MPKAAKEKQTQRADPIAKPEKPKKTKNPKDSHLYTDDNPSTTIHGTGFSSAAKARDTLELIKHRSLTYQFQTCNTMYHRAAHHPHMSTSPGIQEGMAVFREWLGLTYPAERVKQEEYKPVLSKKCVESWLPILKEKGTDTAWAERYVQLARGKRLGNVLLDDKDPQGQDMESQRFEKLVDLNPEGETQSLWADRRTPAPWHAQCIAYAWSPYSEKVLGGPDKKSYDSD